MHDPDGSRTLAGVVIITLMTDLMSRGVKWFWWLPKHIVICGSLAVPTSSKEARVSPIGADLLYTAKR